MVGQFKDDRMQSHTHSYTGSWASFGSGSTGALIQLNQSSTGGPTGRSGNTTRGKRKGVKYIIKVL